MTNTQIIIISILGILSAIGYFGAGLTKNEKIRPFFLFLILFTTAAFALVAVTAVIEMEKLRKETKNKCPEYEKVENVYRLKQ